jgi:hypothetical protein
LKVVGFPTHQGFAWGCDEDSASDIEYSMSDVVRSFAKTNPSGMRMKRRRLRYRKLEGVGPVRRTILQWAVNTNLQIRSRRNWPGYSVENAYSRRNLSRLWVRCVEKRRLIFRATTASRDWWKPRSWIGSVSLGMSCLRDYMWLQQSKW